MNQEELEKLAFVLFRRNLDTLARLKALESIVRHEVPAAELSAWDKAIDEQTNRILQKYLEDVEMHSPEIAAQIDDRGPEFMIGLDEPLLPP